MRYNTIGVIRDNINKIYYIYYYFSAADTAIIITIY